MPLHFSKYVCMHVCVCGGEEGGNCTPISNINVGPGLIIKKIYTIVFDMLKCNHDYMYSISIVWLDCYLTSSLDLVKFC